MKCCESRCDQDHITSSRLGIQMDGAGQIPKSNNFVSVLNQCAAICALGWVTSQVRQVTTELHCSGHVCHVTSGQVS
jgi:hypothetical protein